MKQLLIILFFLIISLKVTGQPCPGNIPDACTSVCEADCTSDECLACVGGVPIDGGLSWLLLSGIGLAAGRFIRKKKKNK